MTQVPFAARNTYPRLELGKPTVARGVPAPALAEAGPSLAWLLVVHPNPEVLTARVASVQSSYRGVNVTSTCSGSEALRWCEAQDAPGAVLVHVRGVDRFHGGWGGHRLVARIARRGHVPAIAWVAADDIDGHELAMTVGAAGLLTYGNALGLQASSAVPERLCAPGMPRDAQLGSHDRARTGEDPILTEWFLRRYGRPWEPWIEHASALIIGGGERTGQAEILRKVLSPSTTDHARRRLRQVNETLCGEIRGNEAVLRREALVVLTRIGRLRPIVASPLVARSLQRAAALLRSDPSLRLEGAIDAPDVADLLEVAAEELTVGIGGGSRRGRPEAGTWRVRREQALGRVAERRGKTAAEKIAALEALREVVDRVVNAVHDTIEDRDRESLG
jgi:hypothetical protein